MRVEVVPQPDVLSQAERLTLGVLLCGVASLSLSDFVSPAYWLLTMSACLLRYLLGVRLALSEMQASLLGWAGFFWVGAELFMGRAWLVALTDFLLILSLAVSIEAPTPRNHLHRLITGTFLILAASVLTDSVLYALPLAAYLMLFWRACRRLYGIATVGGDLPIGSWRADGLALLTMLAASLLLFILAPRFDIGGGLKNIQPRLRLSGFSDQVALGDFARLLDPTIVMRIEAPGLPDAQARRLLQGRYWRGVVMSRFDGHGWLQMPDGIRQRVAAGGILPLAKGKVRAGIVMYREAVEYPYLMLPDGLLRLPDLPQAAGLSENGSVLFAHTPDSRLRVPMQLAVGPVEAELRPPLEEERQPPASKAIAAWTRQVIAGATTPAQQLLRLAATLRQWQYSLQTDIDARHPIEHFLLQTHSGHCEMFASAMALAARTLGIPARVVNGYYGGEWNGDGSFLTIRQQHAHAWVEAWLDGRWQRFDPTPASRWQMGGERFAGLEHAWDALRLSWYRYVLEFNSTDRSSLFGSLRRWGGYAFWLLLPIALIVLLRRSGIHLWQRQASPYWGTLDHWLARHGIARRCWQPLVVLPTPAGVDVGQWHDFVVAWELQAYGARPSWGRHELRRHLRALTRMS
jgi:protein-glutamine gamma-glutamyltransferase